MKLYSSIAISAAAFLASTSSFYGVPLKDEPLKDVAPTHSNTEVSEWPMSPDDMPSFVCKAGVVIPVAIDIQPAAQNICDILSKTPLGHAQEALRTFPIKELACVGSQCAVRIAPNF